MHTLRFLDLIALNGSEKGHVYTIENNAYRILGQSEADSSSSDMPFLEHNHPLNPDQQERAREVMLAHAAKIESCKRASDILISDPGVSRTHAMVALLDGQASVTDLLSKTGLFKNGFSSISSALSDGDTVQLGTTRFLVKLG